MLVKFGVIFILVNILFVKGSQFDWDLAIVVGNKIQLLSSNGTVIESRSPFSPLQAITYDGIRDQFIVSDRDSRNDTIFTVRLTKETVTEPIMKVPPRGVQGLAIDHVNDVLYWSNSKTHTINYVSLNDTVHESKEFIKFENEEVPHAIAIDVCKRYMYYTNLLVSKPTIERRSLDNSHSEILVGDTIKTPVGLAIDYKDQRLYWADSRIGTLAGRIESISLDGKDRRLVVERTNMEPLGIAVDEDAIYWTDTNNRALYKFLKSETDPYAVPKKLITFDEMPMGLVANYFMKDDCEILEKLIHQYKESKQKLLNATTAQPTEQYLRCFNGGTVEDNMCQCKQGYTGNYCEIPICSIDYCLKGNCYLSRFGKPMCSCKKGYIGNRCQKFECDDYCLNEGECTLNDKPTCKCQDGFFGTRCEYKQVTCDLYCNENENSAYSAELEYICRCSYIYSERNASALLSRLQEQPSILSKLQDPVVYLSAFVLFCILVIMALFIYIHNIHKKRPRIKKRIIVNKNVTPLTFRPQQNTEQCEITIENCCNMNICETPCFEPTGEDKKKLLTNMEGEDIY